MQSETIPLSKYIIHEDNSLVVINKPSGMLSIPDGYSRDLPNLVHLLKSRYGEIWTVHRIDKESSGVNLFARTAQSHRILSMQFEARKTGKTYHAVVNSVPGWNEKIIRLPLRINAGRKHLTRADLRHGKPAETRFHVIKRFRSRALIEAKPLTGYRHQIRAHLYALGMNILGDPLYNFGAPDDGAPFTAVRMMLHAYQLTVIHPISGTSMTFTAPYPEDFFGLLQQIEKAEHS